MTKGFLIVDQQMNTIILPVDDPDLVEALGLDLDTDEGAEEWLSVVQDAARQYLDWIGK